MTIEEFTNSLSDEQNSIHAFKNGLMPVGEKHRLAKLSDNQVREIRKYKEIRNGVELMKKFNISSTQISRIKNFIERRQYVSAAS